MVVTMNHTAQCRLMNDAFLLDKRPVNIVCWQDRNCFSKSVSEHVCLQCGQM